MVLEQSIQESPSFPESYNTLAWIYADKLSSNLDEAEELVKNGAKEITLLGQNVNAYSYSDGLKKYKILKSFQQLLCQRMMKYLLFPLRVL